MFKYGDLVVRTNGSLVVSNFLEIKDGRIYLSHINNKHYYNCQFEEGEFRLATKDEIEGKVIHRIWLNNEINTKEKELIDLKDKLKKLDEESK